MNFLDHKDLGNHLLQLCPKVVKHPVYCKNDTRTSNVKSLRYSHFLGSSTERITLYFSHFSVSCSTFQDPSHHQNNYGDTTQAEELGPYNDWGTGGTTEELGSDFPPWQNIFLLSFNPKPALEPTQSPIQWVKWNFPRGEPTGAWILTTFLHPAKRLRMNETIPSPHHMPS